MRLFCGSLFMKEYVNGHEVKINSILICKKAQSFVRMDPQHTDDLLKHLEKQNDLLKEAHKTMSQELQKLMVEEQIMMQKLYELMINHRLNKKKMEETQNVLEAKETGEASDKYESLRPPVIYTYHRKKKKKSGRNK